MTEKCFSQIQYFSLCGGMVDVSVLGTDVNRRVGSSPTKGSSLPSPFPSQNEVLGQTAFNRKIFFGLKTEIIKWNFHKTVFFLSPVPNSPNKVFPKIAFWDRQSFGEEIFGKLFL